jgi:hypothetical protein
VIGCGGVGRFEVVVVVTRHLQWPINWLLVWVCDCLSEAGSGCFTTTAGLLLA